MREFTVSETALGQMPDVPVRIMMNVGTPEQAFEFSRLPHHGIGLARPEFIINRQIGIHPRALLELDDQVPAVKEQIEAIIGAYAGPREFSSSGSARASRCSPRRSRRSRSS